MDIERNKLARIGAGALIVLIALIAFIIKNGSPGKDIIVTDKAGAEVPAAVQSESGQDQVQGGESDIMITMPEEQIVIDVAGAVVSPGVIKLKQESRVYEAVEKAGGLSKDADTDYINMAALLQDGEKIYIPKKGEYEEQEPGSAAAGAGAKSAGGGFTASYPSAASAQSGRININTATSEQLQTLTGIGPSIAQKIIDYRQTKGGFKQIEDIKNVNGIGEKIFSKFKDKITV